MMSRTCLAQGVNLVVPLGLGSPFVKLVDGVFCPRFVQRQAHL